MKSPGKRFVVSTPALDSTAADMASVTANAIRTSVDGHTGEQQGQRAGARGRCAASIDALWR